MTLQSPGGVDDFGNTPAEDELRRAFIQIWNSEEKYLGQYAKADPDFPNYVDPRIEPPVTGAVPVSWNGFPKLLSRWFDDEADGPGREQAEAAADVLIPMWSWVETNNKGKSFPVSCAPHQVPYYAELFGPHVTQLARPRRLLKADGSPGAELVEEYRQQDEYLEWFAKRDSQGRLLELHFTAEAPDYWQALAEVSREKVLALYEKILGHSVPQDEVFYPADIATIGRDAQGNIVWFETNLKGQYNPLNIWTTRKGIIHLTHWANTLGAEVNLAKQASAALQCDSLPPPPLKAPSAEVRRIACGKYGGINRSSDPLIGLGVGDHVADSSRITLTDPVGLYILNCDLGGLKNPDGQAVGGAARTVVRGSENAVQPRLLRVELKAPTGANYVLGDCTLDGRSVERGGQVARKTTMGLYAQVYPGTANTSVSPCLAIPCRNSTRPSHFTTSDDMDGLHLCPASRRPGLADGNSVPANGRCSWRPRSACAHPPPGKPCGSTRQDGASQAAAGQTRTAWQMMEPLLKVDDIQGHVLVGFGGGHEILLGMRLRAGAVANAKAALLSCIDLVTPARASVAARELRRSGVSRAGPTPDTGQAGLAISFSHPGLMALGQFEGPRDDFFWHGAFAAASALHDEVSDDSLPVGWHVGGNNDSTPHVFFVLAASSLAVVESAEAELVQKVSAPFDVIYRKYGRRLQGEREHFGFVDGISQPAPRGLVDGAPLIDREYAADHALASDYARPGQPLVWPGQFLFGYPTQQAESQEPGAELGGGDPLLRNGSLLVFRQFRQDVSAFTNAMRQLASDFTDAGLAVDEATAAAWCVGRWPDGTPVSVSPQAPDDSIACDSYRRNGFLFRSKLDAAELTDRKGKVHAFAGAPGDRAGKSCPLFSHIRKVNPRDLAPDQGGIGVTLKSQMLRRGIPYGRDWTGMADDEDRGLLFLAYQTSIENQFHRLMSLWVNNPSAPHGQGIDPLIGAPQGGRVLTRVPADNRNYIATIPGRWVTATGGGYFFAPGIKALRAILSQ